MPLLARQSAHRHLLAACIAGLLVPGVCPRASAAPAASPTLIRVVLIAGQSNADGRAPGSGLPVTPVNYQLPQESVSFYYQTHGRPANADGSLGVLTTLRPGATEFPAGGFGPEISLGHTLAEQLATTPDTGLALIKYAKGNSSLHTDWKAGGDATLVGDGPHYQTWQRVVRDGLAALRARHPAATVKLSGLVWVQGETDIVGGAAVAAAYEQNLTRLITDVRATVDPNLPFLISRISSSQTAYAAPNDPDYPAYLVVRAHQAAVANATPGVALIDTDGPGFTTNADRIHFDPSGQLALGRAFAARLGQRLVLRVSSIQSGPDGFDLTWNAAPLRRYLIQTSPNLRDWTAFPVGATATWRDDPTFTPPAPGGRFYRVAEQD